jgi:hypothetical protein
MERWLRRACGFLLASFWILVAVGGVANEGYRQYEDFVSSLASRGVAQPWIGIAALTCAAAAHAVVVPLLRRQDPAVAWAVLTAAGSLLAVAAFRVQCPRAPYCLVDRPWDWVDAVHATAVMLYALAMITAMLRGGLVAVRIPSRRSLGLASLLAATFFVVALVLTLGPVPGLSQRFWILAGQVWLVAVAWTPFATPTGMPVGTGRVRVIEHSTKRRDAS